MLKFFRTLLGERDAQAPEATPSVALAAAALMLETARADTAIDESELHTLREHLGARFGLARSEIDALTDEALSEVDDATGFFEFTSIIAEHYDYDARVDLVRALWSIALADDTIDRFEEHTVRRVSDLLHVAHRDFIRAKLDARDGRR